MAALAHPHGGVTKREYPLCELRPEGVGIARGCPFVTLAARLGRCAIQRLQKTHVFVSLGLFCRLRKCQTEFHAFYLRKHGCRFTRRWGATTENGTISNFCAFSGARDGAVLAGQKNAPVQRALEGRKGARRSLGRVGHRCPSPTPHALPAPAAYARPPRLRVMRQYATPALATVSLHSLPGSPSQAPRSSRPSP